MGILTRFKDIMSANINALLDKCEDPEKMIDQYMRNLESDLGKVKAETASVMAEETRCKRELDECTADVAKYQSYAEKALKAGNEADARTFLEKKQQLVSKQATLQQTYNIAADNAAKMRQMHDKLCKDIQSLEARRDAVKAKVAAAKAQERINKVGSSVNSVGTSMDAFGKMEAKANKMLDEANAMAELNQTQLEADVDSLAAKYDAEPANTAVDDELAALLEEANNTNNTSSEKLSTIAAFIKIYYNENAIDYGVIYLDSNANAFISSNYNKNENAVLKIENQSLITRLIFPNMNISNSKNTE